jgi:hypothetical protein
VNCPLCGQRKARRACPALGQNICTVCCGTKRLITIACPADCPYLVSARDHPPARVVRQQEDDLAWVARSMQDLNDRQAHLFFSVLTFLARYSSTSSRQGGLASDVYSMPSLESVSDEDVTEAFAAMAATYETASRGVFYEHRPQGLAAERLVTELKPLLAEAGKGGGSVFERDAAVVLRRVEAATRQRMADSIGTRRAFLDLIGRVVRAPSESDRTPGEPEPAPRLILP